MADIRNFVERTATIANKKKVKYVRHFQNDYCINSLYLALHHQCSCCRRIEENMQHADQREYNMPEVCMVKKSLITSHKVK